jgi:hypothetical protein
MSHLQAQPGSGVPGSYRKAMSAPQEGYWDDRYFVVDAGGSTEPKQSRVFTCSAGGELKVERRADNPSYGASSADAAVGSSFINR